MSHCCGSIRASEGSAGQTGAPGSGLPPGVTDNDALIWDSGSGLWVPTQLIRESLHYGFGAGQIITGISFLFPFYDASASLATEAGRLQVLRDGTLRGLRATHATPTAADTLVYTIMVGGVASAFDITLSSGSAAGSALAEALVVVEGDQLSIQVTGATGARTVRATIQFYLEADIP